MPMTVRRVGRASAPPGGMTTRRRHPPVRRSPRRVPSASIVRWFPWRASARGRSTRPVWHTKRCPARIRPTRAARSRMRRNPRTRHGEDPGPGCGPCATRVRGSRSSGCLGVASEFRPRSTTGPFREAVMKAHPQTADRPGRLLALVKPGVARSSAPRTAGQAGARSSREASCAGRADSVAGFWMRAAKCPRAALGIRSLHPLGSATICMPDSPCPISAPLAPSP